MKNQVGLTMSERRGKNLWCDSETCPVITIKAYENVSVFLLNVIIRKRYPKAKYTRQ